MDMLVVVEQRVAGCRDACTWPSARRVQRYLTKVTREGGWGRRRGREDLGGPHTQWVVARREVSEQMKESQHVNAQPRARQSRGCRTLIELIETASRSSTVPGGSGSRHSSRGCTERFTIGMAANQPASDAPSSPQLSLMRGTELHKLLRLIPSSRILLEFF
jgi:hypothetical protein